MISKLTDDCTKIVESNYLSSICTFILWSDKFPELLLEVSALAIVIVIAIALQVLLLDRVG